MDLFCEWVASIGPVKVARLLVETDNRVVSLRYQSVQGWVRRGLPSSRVLSVEALSGIPRSVLRPDLYPSESSDVGG